jgi:signal transduction histidine kinase
MRFNEYLNDKKRVILVCLAAGIAFTILLFCFGLGAGEIILLWLCFFIVFFGFLGFDYMNKRKRIQYLLSVMDTLDKKYLLAEVTDKPETVLEQIYFRLLKTALKAMTDEVAQSNRVNDEYREYIEQWIHEIKVPITGIKLVCENNKTDDIRKILSQTELIERDVERVLFYARLGSVEKDYFIKEIALKDCVMNVLARNKQFLIQNGARVDTEFIPDNVYSDDKWIEFIINQIIINCIKYRSERSPVIAISSKDMGGYIVLSVTDNGFGIRQSEVSRIFDKGFVGSNGRASKNATGIGLYLCKQLCIKLGIDIDVESEVNQYTTVRLHFPKNSHLNI